MRWSILGLVVFGIVAALSASVLVASLKSQGFAMHKDSVTEPVDVQVLVARKDLPAMLIVSADDIETQTVTREQAPHGYLSNIVQVAGRVLLAPMAKGQSFTATCFAREGSGVHLASALPEGKRAVGVLLSDHTGLEGLIYPGCMVDVLVAYKAQAGDAVSKTLLQDIQVLSIEDQTIVTPDLAEKKSLIPSTPGKRFTVSLLVDSEQAEMLQSAMEYGTVSLAMRNPLDKTMRKASEHQTQLEAAPHVWEMTILRDRKPETKKFEYASQK